MRPECALPCSQNSATCKPHSVFVTNVSAKDLSWRRSNLMAKQRSRSVRKPSKAEYNICIKHNGKVFQLQARLWPRGWVEVQLYSSMTTALEGGEWSAARPGLTLPPGKTRYPLYRRLGGPQGRSGRAENLSPPRLSYVLLFFKYYEMFRKVYPKQWSSLSPVTHIHWKSSWQFVVGGERKPHSV